MEFSPFLFKRARAGGIKIMKKHLLRIGITGFIFVLAVALTNYWQKEPILLPKQERRVIQTTLDPRLQQLAITTLVGKLAELKTNGQLPKETDLAFVALDNQTGDVL